MTQQNPSLPSRQVIAPPRPAHATDRYDGPTELYRLYDADDQLLYIGITCNKAARWDRHRSRSPWWKLVARKDLTSYPDRSAALTAEREAILAENPIHNIVGHPQRLSRHVRVALTEERAGKLRALAEDRGQRLNAVIDALIDEASFPSEHPAAEPSDLDVAISVAQQLLDSDQVLSLRESLRLLLRALGAEPVAEQEPAARCPAAHRDDPTPCDGPAVVTVLDEVNAGATGCEHHGARLLASLVGGRVYALPDAPAGAALRVFRAADGTRPFAWCDDAPRTQPSQLSNAENRRRGEDQ